MVSEDGSTAIVNVTFNETRLELPEGREADDRSTTSSPSPSTASRSTSAPSSPRACPSSSASARRSASIFAGDRAHRDARVAPRGGAPDRHGARRRRRRRDLSLAFSGVVEHGVGHPGARRHARPRGRHRLLAVHRLPPPQAADRAACRCRSRSASRPAPSGTAVVFAGSTVIVALLALNVTGIPFLGLMGTVGAVCIAVAVLVAITLAPAILGLIGARLLSRRKRATIGSRDHAAHKAPKRDQADVEPPRDPHGARHRRAAAGHRHPVDVDAARPARRRRASRPDRPATRRSRSSRRSSARARTARCWSPRRQPTPISDDDLLATQVEVAQQLADLDDVAAVAPIATSDDNTLLAFQVVPEEGPNSESTAQLVQDIRALPPVGRRPHARRRRSGGEQHRHLAGAERRPADLPRWWSSACRSSS